MAQWHGDGPGRLPLTQCTITLGATWFELTVTSIAPDSPGPLLTLIAARVWICRDAAESLASRHRVSHWWLSGASLLPPLPEPLPKSRLVKKHSDEFAQPAAWNAAAKLVALS